LWYNLINMIDNSRNKMLINFLERVMAIIIANVKPENYFILPTDKKTNILYLVFKLIKSSIKNQSKNNSDELKEFIINLLKISVNNEKYEFAAILKDICNNFDSMYEISKGTDEIGKFKIKQTK
jgi:hypothetical protein